MPELDLRMADADWRRLRSHCAPAFRGRRDTELGAIGLIAKRQVNGTLRELVVTKMLWPEDGDVISHPYTALTFSSRYMRRAHLMMREEKLAGVITFHTHPFSDTRVDFSEYDDAEDPLLEANLVDLHPSTWLSSVVLGRQSQKGRVWLSPADVVPLNNLISIGNHIDSLPLDGNGDHPRPEIAEIFDRGRALTGTGALAKLAGSTVVVVGASGTGCLICELLARAGCRRILLIDYDIVKIANLNRILYATREDAEKRRYKAHVIKRGIEALGLGCEVVPIIGSVLDRAVLAQLNEADVIFGCVDKDLPRMILCQYSYQHLVPYLDVGAEIGGDDEGIVSTDARTNYVAPGRWCLRCTGLVTARRLAFESLAATERQRQVALGYSDDLLLKQPAVMDLNMRAASSGVMILRHLLQPFLLEPLPVTLAENLVTYNMKPVEVARAKDAACDICQSNPHAGYSDCAPPLGFDTELANALIDWD